MNILLLEFMNEEHKNKFKQLYEYCKKNEDYLYNFFNKCPFFVDHGWRHVNNVLSILDALLLPKFIEDPNYLSSNELFYLLSAALLHDIGLGYRGKLTEEDKEITKDVLDDCLKIRKIHGRLSARMIEEMAELRVHLGEDAFIVAKIVQYHQSKAPLTRNHMIALGEKSIEKTWIEEKVKDSTGETIRVRLLAAYLRLADAIDINQWRVSPYQKYMELEQVLRLEVEELRESIKKRLGLLAKLGKIYEEEVKMLKEALDRISDQRISEDKFRALKRRVEEKIRRHIKHPEDEELEFLIKETLKLLKKLELLKYQYKHYRKHKSIAEIVFPKDTNQILLIVTPLYDIEGLRIAKEEIQKEIQAVKNIIGENYTVITQLEKDAFPDNYIDIREWYTRKKEEQKNQITMTGTQEKQIPIQLIEKQVEKVNERVRIKLKFKALEDNIELLRLIGIVKGQVTYLSPYLKESGEDIVFEPPIKLNKNETFECRIEQITPSSDKIPMRVEIKSSSLSGNLNLL